MTAQPSIKARTAALLTSVAITLLFGARLAAADAPAVKHPNLLLNREEIDQVKSKIKEHDWAAKLLERVRKLADSSGHTEKNPRDAALVYVLTGEQRYAAAARRSLLRIARLLLPQLEKLDIRENTQLVNAVNFGRWAPSAGAAPHANAANPDALEVAPGTAHEQLEGWIPALANEEELRQALEKAFDYRGDITITRKDGSKIEGYIFDRRSGASLKESVVRLYPKNSDEKIAVSYADIGALAFTGRDTAAGKSWEGWMKKYAAKKAAGEQDLSLHPEPLD